MDVLADEIWGLAMPYVAVQRDLAAVLCIFDFPCPREILCFIPDSDHQLSCIRLSSTHLSISSSQNGQGSPVTTLADQA